MSATFKFYLAFENSLCDDYITEKFFTTLRYNMVPVVLGGGDYSAYVPRGSYIDVLDFGSPRALARYLLYLDKNATAYNAFFAWKKHASFVQRPDLLSSMRPVCDMCIQLNLEKRLNATIKTSVINDVYNFWNTERDCRRFIVETHQLAPWD